MSTLARTPLFDWHVAHHGRMVDFAGWEMPVQYTSIVDEHNTTRTAVGVFDISHMGRLRFEGTGAAAFLNRLVTRRVDKLGLGKIRYALVTNEQGGILDDVLVYHLHDQPTPAWMLVVNASNREKIVAWINGRLTAADQVACTDQTRETAMIAVQGPRALSVLAPLVKADLPAMAYYSGVAAEICGGQGLVSRTGYTGEDGCELIVPVAAALGVWEQVFSAGQAAGVTPVGLGARDTLRLEAAMPLYGHELNEQINPFQAGLAFAVNLEDRQFPGRDALAKFKDDSKQPVRIGLEMAGRRVPREKYPVLAGTEAVGEVTSGTFSPTLQRPIAMAYVRPECAELGRELAVDIRGKAEPARVVKLPFYSRS